MADCGLSHASFCRSRDVSTNAKLAAQPSPAFHKHVLRRSVRRRPYPVATTQAPAQDTPISNTAHTGCNKKAYRRHHSDNSLYHRFFGPQVLPYLLQSILCGQCKQLIVDLAECLLPSEQLHDVRSLKIKQNLLWRLLLLRPLAQL